MERNSTSLTLAAARPLPFMRRLFVFIPRLFVLIIPFLLFSCDKQDDNGRLGGLWQMKEWKSLPSGQVVAGKEDRIFYSVQLDLMKFQKIGDTEASYFLSRFSHRGDSLIIGTVYSRPNDSIVSVSMLAPYGVPKDGRFHIDHLSDHSLVLSSDSARLTFRKY